MEGHNFYFINAFRLTGLGRSIPRSSLYGETAMIEVNKHLLCHCLCARGKYNLGTPASRFIRRRLCKGFRHLEV